MPTYTLNNVNYNYTIPGSGTTGTATVTDSSGAFGFISILSSFVVNSITYTVTSISNNAFMGSNIESIIIANTITSIGNNSFYQCLKLKDVQFNGLIPTIGTGNFGILGDTVYYDSTLNSTNQNVTNMLSMFSKSSIINLNDNLTFNTNFGTSGVTTMYYPGSSAGNYTNKSVILQNNKILLANSANVGGGDADWVIVRLNESGTLDTTFGTNGYLLSPLNNSLNDFPVATLVRTDGSFIVVGTNWTGTSAANGDQVNITTVVRLYNENGTEITTFSFLSLTGALERAGDAVLLSDNSLIICLQVGQSLNSNNTTAIIAKLNFNGSQFVYDTNFGSGFGYVVFDLLNSTTGNSEEISTTLKIDSNNNIIVGGYILSTSEAFLLRTNSTGTTTVSNRFKFDGVTSSAIYDLLIQPDNKIIVSGTMGANITVARINSFDNSSISYDPTFSTNGITTIDVSGILTDFVWTSALQQNGKILVGGQNGTVPYIMRLTSSGQLDTTFNSNGKYTFNNLTGRIVDILINNTTNKITCTGDGYGNNVFAVQFNLAVGNPSQIVYPICFPAGTPVLTDQGEVAIDKINPKIHTINNKKILDITKTITLEKHIVCIEKDALGPNTPSRKTFISRNHEIIYNKKRVKAKELIGKVDGVYNKKYYGETLYNVLMETHYLMIVNNMIVETLDPASIIGQLYLRPLSFEQKNLYIKNINESAKIYTQKHQYMR